MSIEVDIEQFVKSAVEYISSNGAKKALKVFSDPDGIFTHNSRYIFAINYKGPKNGYCLAHPYFPSLVNADHSHIVDGYHGANIWRLAKEKIECDGKGWICYRWEDPVTHHTKLKHTFVMPVPDCDFFVAAGYYEDQFEPKNN